MAEDNPRGDELIGKTEEAAAGGTGGKELQAANLFDLRRIIGGLFVLYGIILTIVGLFDSQAEIDKAAGVHINLWEGLAMIVLGGLFLLWGFLRPLGRQLAEAEQEATSEQPGGRPGSDGEGAVRSRDAGR
jgi:uncharacterized membrane protein